jgi:ribosomal protein S7
MDLTSSNSTKDSQWKSRTKFSGVPVPHRNTVQNLVNKIIRTRMLMAGKQKCQQQVLTEQLHEIRISKGTTRTTTSY